MRRFWRPWFLILLSPLALCVALALAQTISTHTEIFNFVNGIRLGGGTTITGASGTGAGALTLPTNSISLMREVVGIVEPVTFCGDLPNAGTTYLGPGLLGLNGTPTDYILAGTACNALDSATEATADAPISTLATKVLGFRCKISAAPGTTKSVVFTLRTDVADAVTTDGGGTTVTCSVVGAATECRANIGTTTNIAASGTVAMKAVSDYDASTADARCVAMVTWP